ncbi:glycosyltransferase [Leptolyngbya sp. FACHB-36]|uniref:glycosyltransferase n=1 Tax=Leptolyngbya sp. FACHB-36 TaxID=2692808 RepID=UPI00168048A5|nr:glycosyltransferase [Leptolyngbya sp. FACHB-36]MBD2020369.1 glycosyltransferase [Leptolyngbya sp. FACHB-36]
MLLLQLVLTLLVSGSIAFYVACAVCTQRFFAASNSATKSLGEPVSILVPVCGVDAAAWENWSSLCQQDYPEYEVLFGVVDPTDLAVPLLHRLAETFPDRVRLFIGLEPRGINHKDSTLSYLLEAKRHEVIVFVDSDIQVSSDYLRTVTGPLAEPEVGMVTCAFIGHNPKGLTAALAALGRGCDFIPSALVAQALDGGLKFAVGATIAVRQSSLTDAGGLHLSRIGSDYNLGKRMAQAGYRVELSRYVLESDTGHETLRDLFQRELRWARTIRFNRGPIYYTLPICYGTVFCLPLLLFTGWQPWAIALSLITLIIRISQAGVALVALNCPNLLRWLWLLPLRDLLSVAVWAIGAVGRSVYWRGRKLEIQSDGIITPAGE